MRKGVERWTATATVAVGVAMLAVALYARAGEALATQAAPVQRAAVPSPPVDFDKPDQAHPRGELPRVPQRGQAQGRPVACRVHRRARWWAQRRGRAARPGGQQLAARARQRRSGRSDAARRSSRLSDAEIATLRQWVDQGARLTPSSPPAPAPWEAPLALTAPAVPAAVWAAWDRPADRLVAAYLCEGQGSRATIDRRHRVRAPRVSRHLGASAFPRRDPGVCRAIRRPTSGIGSSRRCSPTTPSTRRTGCRSGTTCSATTMA